MVGSISSVSLSSASSTTSSSSTSTSDLATRLAAKQQALAAARTADERKSIQAEIDALKTQIEAQSSATSGSQKSQAGDPPVGGPPGGHPPEQGSTAHIGMRNFDSSTPFGNRQMYV